MSSILLLDAYIQSAQADPPDRFTIVYDDEEETTNAGEQYALTCAAERSRQHQTIVTVWRNNDCYPLAFAFGGMLYTPTVPTVPACPHH